jgi:hypothetical protein
VVDFHTFIGKPPFSLADLTEVMSLISDVFALLCPLP